MLCVVKRGECPSCGPFLEELQTSDPLEVLLKNCIFARGFAQKLRSRSRFCSKFAFSLEVLLKNCVFARGFAQKLRFRSRFCSKIAFSLEVLFKNCVFARGFVPKIAFSLEVLFNNCVFARGFAQKLRFRSRFCRFCWQKVKGLKAT